ncbi:MAG: nucleotidyltransferase domain-containing protein [Bacteroidales bacterium]|nr:nucleotidyltransferase domain-containing protein [Candidatus Scybalocola fimicaballi]
MRNEEYYDIIRSYFKTQPIEKAWVFGSFARNENDGDSDIDILVKFTPNISVGLFKYSRIIRELTELLNIKVDLVEEGSLLPFAAESAERDKILIYERETE